MRGRLTGGFTVIMFACLEAISKSCIRRWGTAPDDPATVIRVPPAACANGPITRPTVRFEMTSPASAQLYTAEQVRGLDHAAIHGLGIAGYELMQRAGRAVTEAARGRFPQARNWLILCGPGNNGGDGYVVARLAREAGFSVTVCALSDPDKLQGDAARACADWQQGGGRIATWPIEPDGRFDLALDALLGTGISREVGGVYRQAIDFLNGLACPSIAIDIPSGLECRHRLRHGLLRARGAERDVCRPQTRHVYRRWPGSLRPNRI